MIGIRERKGRIASLAIDPLRNLHAGRLVLAAGLVVALTLVPACRIDVDVSGAWQGSYRLSKVGSVIGAFAPSGDDWLLADEAIEVGALSTAAFDLDMALEQSGSGALGGAFGDPTRNLTFPVVTNVTGSVAEEVQGASSIWHVCVNTVHVVEPGEPYHFARDLQLGGAENQTIIRYVTLDGVLSPAEDKIEGFYQEVLSGMVPHDPGALIVLRGSFLVRKGTFE